MIEISEIDAPPTLAASEAMGALDNGKHLVLSTEVSLEEEAELKKIAFQRGLLAMGPRYGTILIGDRRFGFTNALRKGPISIVGTLGTGIQEISCLINILGVSHAIGVGTRDLSQKVNAYGTLSALRFLEADEATKAIVLVGKFPPTSVARRVLDAITLSKKPVVACLLGGQPDIISRSGAIPALTLEDAAIKIMNLFRKRPPKGPSIDEISKMAKGEYSRFGYGQKYIRGFFSGGALCHEAMLILQGLVGDVYSNVPLKPRLRLPDIRSTKRHTCVDLGGEDLPPQGNPILDLRPKCDRLLREAKDWEAAVVMVDVVLGLGCHPDPAGEVSGAVKEAKRLAEMDGGYLSVVASIVGTPYDPQKLDRQREKLEKAGVIVMNSNAQAARVAALVATRGSIAPTQLVSSPKGKG